MKTLTILVAFLLNWAAVAEPNQASGKIVGKVENFGGLQGFVVELKSQKTGQTVTTVSDDKGVFYFDVNPGTYQISTGKFGWTRINETLVVEQVLCADGSRNCIDTKFNGGKNYYTGMIFLHPEQKKGMWWEPSTYVIAFVVLVLGIAVSIGL